MSDLSSAAIDDIIADFELIGDWEERYRYVIELGRALEPLPDSARTEANKVRGCASQVWLETSIAQTGAAGPVLTFRGDSDAHIVKGLVYILLTLFSGRPAGEIVELNALDVFARLGLTAHLTPQRSNGVRAMVERIRAEARHALTMV